MSDGGPVRLYEVGVGEAEKSDSGQGKDSSPQPHLERPLRESDTTQALPHETYQDARGQDVHDDDEA